jgi:hypothetical protein
MESVHTAIEARAALERAKRELGVPGRALVNEMLDLPDGLLLELVEALRKSLGGTVSR